MSTERQAKNKKKQKARKETVELFNLEFKTQGGGEKAETLRAKGM